MCSRKGISAYLQVALSFHRIVIVLKIEENLNSSEAYNYAFLLPNRNVLWSVVMIHWRVTCKEGRWLRRRVGGWEQSWLPSHFLLYLSGLCCLTALPDLWLASNKLGGCFWLWVLRLPPVISVISDFRVLGQIPPPLNHMQTQGQMMTSETYV